MASNSGWTKGLPSGQSKVSNTDEEFRSFKSFVEAWLEQEHYVTSGSATSAGIAKKGAGRAFVGPASQLSNPTADNDGRLFWNTGTGTLFIGQASSSSWSQVADGIQLDSNNSWTGNNEFANLKLTGMFSAITSLSTVLVTAIGATATGSGSSLLNAGSRFARGDILLASAESWIGGNADRTMIRAEFPANSSADVNLILDNQNGSSAATIPSGTTVRVLAFKLVGL